MRLNQSIGKRYPTKTTINLAMKDSRKREWGKVSLAALGLALFIAAFTKFAVIDRLTAANEAEYAAARSLSQLAEYQAANANYDAVLEEYEDYNLSRSVAGIRTDTQDIFKLIKRELLSIAKVESFSSSQGVITAKISGVTLNQISQIFRNLTSDPLVAHVSVYTASSNEENQDALTTASITIELAVESGLVVDPAPGASGTGNVSGTSSAAGTGNASGTSGTTGEGSASGTSGTAGAGSASGERHVQINENGELSNTSANEEGGNPT